MGKLRIVPEGVYTNYNQSMLSGYDAIAFSFDVIAASAIASEDKLSNIISKHIINMKYNSLSDGQIRITSYLDNTDMIWNKHKRHIDIVNKCIYYMDILRICRLNEYKNILLFIESDTYPSCIKLLEYISKQSNINIDVVTLFQNMDKKYTKVIA